MDEKLYNQILSFYTNTDKKYPQYIYDLPLGQRVNAKSQFRQTVRPYHVEHGVVVHGGKEVLVKNRVSTILKACHDNPATGGHFGRDKTYAKISERYFWKGMKNDIAEYIKRCPKCFTVNPKLSKEAPALNSIHVPEKIWSLVGIDIIGPLHESSLGNKYIVAATDHFSKWSEAAAIADKSAKSVADFLYCIICRLGCMDTVISDQGREFVNEVVDTLMERFQTDHRITSAYHPQSNGQRERDNRTLKTALCKLVNEQGDDWDLYIPGVLFAYHTTIHSSTKCTPFEVMYGRPCKLPVLAISSTAPVTADSECINPAVLENLISMRKDLCLKVSSNITAAQHRQKEHYDRRHDGHKVIPVDSTVYIKNSKRVHRMGSKLEPRWIGPYVVVESMSKGRVKLKNVKTNQVLKNAYHASNLKVFTMKDHQQTTTDFSTNLSPDSAEGDGQTAHGRKRRNDDDDITVQKKAKPARMFCPPPGSVCKNIAASLGLAVKKTVYFGRTSELSEPRRVHVTKGDGNCYFRAISFMITGSEDSHNILRDKVVQHMEHDIAVKLQNYLQQNVSDYIAQSQVSRQGVWATDAEIMATASLIGCDVIVYSKFGNSMEWLTYPASFSLGTKTEYALYLQNNSDHFNVVLTVL